MKIFKAFFISFLVSVTPVTLASPEGGCPIKSDEKLVCAVVMCDFGLIMGEWSSECTQHKKDFAIYLATLGFWDKPPKCMMRDENCNKDGKAKKAELSPKDCEKFDTEIQQKACLDGIALNDNEEETPTLELCNSLNSFSTRETCCVSLLNEDDKAACSLQLEEDKGL